MSTPTKISPRNPVCRLCVDSHESHYMLRIFSKAGSTKDLYPKVQKTCGIKISEDDMRSKAFMLCQQGSCFIRKQDGTVCSESPIHREYAVRSKFRICCKAGDVFSFHLRFNRRSVHHRICNLCTWRSRQIKANHTNKKAAFLLNSTSCVSFNAEISRRQLLNPFCGSAEAKYIEVCRTFVFLDTAQNPSLSFK